MLWTSCSPCSQSSQSSQSSSILIDPPHFQPACRCGWASRRESNIWDCRKTFEKQRVGCSDAQQLNIEDGQDGQDGEDGQDGKKNTGWIIAQKDLGDDGCSLHHYYTKPYKTYLMGLLVPLFTATQKRSGQNPHHRKFRLRSGLLLWFCCRLSWYFWKNHPFVLPRSLHNPYKIPTKPRIFMYSSPDFKHIRISMDVPTAFSLLWSENGSKPRYAIFWNEHPDLSWFIPAILCCFGMNIGTKFLPGSSGPGWTHPSSITSKVVSSPCRDTSEAHRSTWIGEWLKCIQRW